MHGWPTEVLNFFALVEEKSWPREAYQLTLVFRRIMDLKVKCGGKKGLGGKRALRRGLRPCSHEPWMETELRGELREKLFSTLRYCLEKGWEGRKKKERIATKDATSVSEWRLSLPLLGFPPGKWVWRGDCQHHTDKVTVGHTLLSLPSLCGCCCVLFLFFPPSISLPLLLSPLCLHLSPCSLYLVAKAFQAASSSLGILEAQQSPHTYTHIL